MRLDDLPQDLREWYEERAAIREYDGREPRAEAERNALDEVLDELKRRTEAGDFGERHETR